MNGSIKFDGVRKVYRWRGLRRGSDTVKGAFFHRKFGRKRSTLEEHVALDGVDLVVLGAVDERLVQLVDDILVQRVHRVGPVDRQGRHAVGVEDPVGAETGGVAGDALVFFQLDRSCDQQLPAFYRRNCLFILSGVEAFDRCFDPLAVARVDDSVFLQ